VRDRVDGVHRLLQSPRVVDVGNRVGHRERDASSIDHNVALRARFAFVRRILTGLLSPGGEDAPVTTVLISKDHTPAGDGGGDDLYSFLIELPEGLFVVDTGDSARNSLKNYLARTNPFFQYAVQIKVAPEEEIGLRLVAMVPGRRSTELCENALGCA